MPWRERWYIRCKHSDVRFGHSRPGRASSNFGHVRYAPKVTTSDRAATCRDGPILLQKSVDVVRSSRDVFAKLFEDQFK
jgi:hypothetical protein